MCVVMHGARGGGRARMECWVVIGCCAALPLQDIGARYPAWLDAHKDSLPPEELQRYSRRVAFPLFFFVFRCVCLLMKQNQIAAVDVGEPEKQSTGTTCEPGVRTPLVHAPSVGGATLLWAGRKPVRPLQPA